jgi:dienelactone hydrolase
MSTSRGSALILLTCVACSGGSPKRPVADATLPVDASTHDANEENVAAAERDAELPARDLTLVGTLAVPAGRRGTRFPAVLFGNGSGPVPRDEALDGQLGMRFGCTVRVFADVAAALQERGYASLRFDKRACGPFNGCSQNGYPAPEGTDTVQTEIDDLRSAAAWLARQPEVDAGRIFYVGHSEGASFAPALLHDTSIFRGAAMLAAGYVPIDQLLANQLAESKELLAKLGISGADADKQLSSLQDAVAALAALRDGKATMANILGGSAAYWKSWFVLTDAVPERASATVQPLLVLSGDYDLNVPPAENNAWKRRFDADGKPEHRTELLSCVTHAMNCISQPDVTKIRREDIGCAVDERVVADVAGFLDSVR